MMVAVCLNDLLYGKDHFYVQIGVCEGPPLGGSRGLLNLGLGGNQYAILNLSFWLVFCPSWQKVGPGTPLDRWGSSCCTGCTKHQPRRPHLGSAIAVRSRFGPKLFSTSVCLSALLPTFIHTPYTVSTTWRHCGTPPLRPSTWAGPTHGIGAPLWLTDRASENKSLRECGSGRWLREEGGGIWRWPAAKHRLSRPSAIVLTPFP